MPIEQNESAQSVAEAMDLLGAAYRGDWSDFDGRALRATLAELSEALRTGEVLDVPRWASGMSICPENRSWAEHCRQRDGEDVGPYWCDHLKAISRRSEAAR